MKRLGWVQLQKQHLLVQAKATRLNTKHPLRSSTHVTDHLRVPKTTSCFSGVTGVSPCVFLLNLLISSCLFPPPQGQLVQPATGMAASPDPHAPASGSPRSGLGCSSQLAVVRSRAELPKSTSASCLQVLVRMQLDSD